MVVDLAFVNSVTLDTVQPESVSWLWPGRIPLGKLTVIDGDPGLGKSLLMLDIAARVTTGRPMPDGSASDLQEPSPVVLLSVEDGLADTIKPRISLAGADTTLTIAIMGVPTPDGLERGVELPDDWPLVFGEVERTGAKLVVLDPLMAFLGGDVNSYRDQDIRRALNPGVRLANDTGAALVVIRHLTKGSGSNAIYRGGGSIGITGAARSVMLVAKDPQDDSGERRIIAMTKSNLAAAAPALAYRVESVETPQGSHPRMRWEGPADYTASDLLTPQDDEQRAARHEAKDFLIEQLSDAERPFVDLLRDARGAGISEATLRRAAKELRVTKAKVGFGKDSRSVWSLPKMITESQRCSPENVIIFGEIDHLSALEEHARDVRIEHERTADELRRWLDDGTLAAFAARRTAAIQVGGASIDAENIVGSASEWLAKYDATRNETTEVTNGSLTGIPSHPGNAWTGAISDLWRMVDSERRHAVRNACLDCGKPCGGALRCHACAAALAMRRA